MNGHQSELDSITEVVAIDGPSGAGKSTVARRLAERLGFAYLDTGAMYRAVTWCLLSRGDTVIDDEQRALEIVRDIDLRVGPGGEMVLDGADVTRHLRSHMVEVRVSAVSAFPGVRRRMRELQRAVARRGAVVAEGRDMGSVVFPRARWKIYLDAAPEERARRRHGDFLARGREVTREEVLTELEVRDRLDSTRRDAPLTRTDDAFYYDSTGRSLEQVVSDLAAYVQGSGDSPRR